MSLFTRMFYINIKYNKYFTYILLQKDFIPIRLVNFLHKTRVINKFLHATKNIADCNSILKKKKKIISPTGGLEANFSLVVGEIIKNHIRRHINRKANVFLFVNSVDKKQKKTIFISTYVSHTVTINGT